MPLPNLNVPMFPNVPDVPGVPPVLRQADAVQQTPATPEATSTFQGTQTPPAWGIYNADGSQAIVPDSFASIEFKKEFKISDYPQEQGAFQSYNKVQTPFDAVIRLTCGGSIEKRTQFLQTLDTLIKSVALLKIITPEITYPSVNLGRYNYKREARNGAHLLIVDATFQEVRTDAAAKYLKPPIHPTAVKSPSAAATHSSGQVQAVPVGVSPPAYLLRGTQ